MIIKTSQFVGKFKLHNAHEQNREQTHVTKAFRVVVIDSTDCCTGYAAVGCFLHFMLRKLEDMRIVFHFDRSKPMLMHLLLFLGIILHVTCISKAYFPDNPSVG